jgi:hypothetical protein
VLPKAELPKPLHRRAEPARPEPVSPVPRRLLHQKQGLARVRAKAALLKAEPPKPEQVSPERARAQPKAEQQKGPLKVEPATVEQPKVLPKVALPRAQARVGAKAEARSNPPLLHRSFR